MFYELSLSCHVFQSERVCDIVWFSNDIKENEFARLLSSVAMSVSQLVAVIVSQRKSNLLHSQTQTLISRKLK